MVGRQWSVVNTWWFVVSGRNRGSGGCRSGQNFNIITKLTTMHVARTDGKHYSSMHNIYLSLEALNIQPLPPPPLPPSWV